MAISPTTQLQNQMRSTNYNNNNSNNNKNNKNKKGPKKGHIIFLIVLLVFLAVVAISYMHNTKARLAREAEESRIAEEEASRLAAEESMVQTESMQIIDNPETSIDLPLYDDSLITQSDIGYVINSNLQYSDATTIAEDSMLRMGNNLSVTPIRSCMYEFTGSNRLNILHTSGATLSIKRGQIREQVDYDKMDAELKGYAQEADASMVSLANVYVGTQLSGRYEKASITINEQPKTLMLAYIVYSGEFYTLVSLADETNSDFMYMMFNSISVGSHTITFE